MLMNMPIVMAMVKDSYAHGGPSDSVIVCTSFTNSAVVGPLV